MAAICLHLATLNAFKSALSSHFTTVKSSHLSEAIASACGFNTHAALLSYVRDLGAAAEVVLVDDHRLTTRLSDLGYSALEPLSLELVNLTSEKHPLPFFSFAPGQLVEMGRKTPDLFHLCRQLQENGHELPGYVSIASVFPLLVKHGLHDDGKHLTINVDDLNRHWSELGEDDDTDQRTHNAPLYTPPSQPRPGYRSVSFTARQELEVRDLVALIDDAWSKAAPVQKGKMWIHTPWYADLYVQKRSAKAVQVDIQLNVRLTLNSLREGMAQVAGGKLMAATLMEAPSADNTLLQPSLSAMGTTKSPTPESEKPR